MIQRGAQHDLVALKYRVFVSDRLLLSWPMLIPRGSVSSDVDSLVAVDLKPVRTILP